MTIDEIDRQIINVLRKDSRTSMTALAEAVHISRAGAHIRVKRLVDAGVISSFTIRTDPVLMGENASAYVTLSLEQEHWQEAKKRLNEIPEIEHISMVGGEFDVLLLVRAKDNRHLRKIVLQDIQSVPSVKNTRTLLIFEDYPGGGPRLNENLTTE